MCFLGDDPGVVFDVGGGGDLVGELDEVVGPADGFQVARFAQLFGHGEQVDGVGALEEAHHGRVDEPVRVGVKAVGPDDVHDVGQGVLVEHEGAEHGFLQGYSLGLHLSEHEVGKVVGIAAHACAARGQGLFLRGVLFCHIVALIRLQS
jgi:hypothetical protein